MSAPVIGIDLGTTYTCAAIFEQLKGITIIPDQNGKRIIPSVVYYNPTNGDVLVGKDAIDEIPECQSNGLFDAKRIIGRHFEDEYISKYLEAKEVPFSIVQATDGRAAFEVSINKKTVLKTPEEVSAEVLKYIKKAASDHLGREVTEAVISVPGRFSNAQRKATKNAAELAGLKVLKLISEPAAAAIHYVFDKTNTNGNILVFDFGGGTLDISIIKAAKKKFEVKVVYGDTFLGGRDIDKILYNHLHKKYVKGRNIKEEQKRIFQGRLRFACENLKRKLAVQLEARQSIPSPFGNHEDMALSITREEFDDLCSGIFKEALNLVEYGLHDSNISKSEICDVILVGGSTRIVKIRQMLGTCFDAHKIKINVHPDEAVAAGASMQARFLKECVDDLEMFNVTEVTPLSLGIELWGKRMQTFIPKNSPLPFEVSRTNVTCENYQCMALIKIFEGERKNTSYNNLLTEFVLHGLPQRRAGNVTVVITFELDEDGILNVTATEKATGVHRSIKVTMDNFRLSERKINWSKEEAIKHKYADDAFCEFKDRHYKHYFTCYNILHDIEKVRLKSDRKFITQNCEVFLKSANKLVYTEIDILDASFSKLMKMISHILYSNGLLQMREA